MIGGVMGKILWVDLSTGSFEQQSIPEKVYEQLLGGMGLAAWVLDHAIPDHADALGSENVLGFLPGLLTGTGAGMAGRWMVVGKSPLTGTWGEANCGGTLGPALKACGLDGVFFRGISPRPVYLWLADGQMELRPADDLWGLDTHQTEKTLRQAELKRTGREVSVACIGPAGEKQSLIAGIVNDYGRLAARSGLGAVMGSKKLKALVASGSQSIPIHDPAELKRLNQKFLKC
ncbi:MAG TPA: aldehyde ferredoxin oxidoreductase N-terminal domain-containing protein, partial [Anaerolineaceae bacterium]|nr:aldehyde ferredoxin oxidoreductase N-terminal domain-containing protein [Anaerolineaceae bacterium]